MIFQLSKGGTCWFCIGYDYVWLMFYGYINSNYIHELSKETVHTSVDSSNSFFLKENPCVSFWPSRCPSAINANVTNGGPRLPVESGCWKLSVERVELSWGLFLEAGNSKPLDVSSHPTKKVPWSPWWPTNGTHNFQKKKHCNLRSSPCTVM